MVEMTATKESISAEITSYGIEYCEEDSFSFHGSPIINNSYQIKIENSPGTNIINNSSNVTINTQINDIRDILTKINETIEKDMYLSVENISEIKDLINEINNNLSANKIPKFGIKSLIEIASGISSIASLSLSLLKFI